MSIEMPKNFQVMLLFAVIIAGGSSIFNYSQTSTQSVVTEDKIKSQDDRILKLEADVHQLQEKDATHSALFAHAGIKSLVDQQGLQINIVRENAEWLERCIFAGECFE